MTEDDLPVLVGTAGALVPGDSPAALARLADKVAAAQATLKTNALSASTQRAYRAHLKAWTAWCLGQGLQPLPASTPMVLAWLHDMEGQLAKDELSVSTVRARLAALAYAQDLRNQETGDAPPVTRTAEVLGMVEALERKHGAPPDQKEPIRREELFEMVTTLPDTLVGHRDRALILLGFMAGLRRSELVALTVEDLNAVREGVEITIWKSKTDQKAEGQLIAVAASHTELCPADALVRWFDEAKIEAGPLFWPIRKSGELDRRQPLSGQAVGLIVKRHAERIGLDPDRFGGHSLRAGFATEAARMGFDAMAIASQTRHRSLETLRGYVRRGSLFHNNPSAALARRLSGEKK